MHVCVAVALYVCVGVSVCVHVWVLVVSVSLLYACLHAHVVSRGFA